MKTDLLAMSIPQQQKKTNERADMINYGILIFTYIVIVYNRCCH